MIVADEMGWTIDLPCLYCGADFCPGSIHFWTPNKQGNEKVGFDSEQEALADAESARTDRQIHCLYHPQSLLKD